MALQFYDNAYLRRLEQHRAEYGGKPWKILRFRLLRLIAASGMKAKVLGGLLSSKRLLAGNVVELVTMKMRKNHKNYCNFSEF